MIFFSNNIGAQLGGPAGYLANLKEGLDSLKTNLSVAIISGPREPKHNSFYTILSHFMPTKPLRRKIASLGEFSDFYICQTNYSGYLDELSGSNFNTVFCHWVKDAIFLNRFREHYNKSFRIVLMSHSPEPPSEELAYMAQSAGKSAHKVNQVRSFWRKLEHEAFACCDYVLFPSIEAMDPYMILDYYGTLIKPKSIFLRTGCKPLQRLTNEEQRAAIEKFGIETKYVVSFIGRHNQIKGYDVLKNIAEKLLQKRDDVTFLIGGSPSKDIAPLKHPRWIEVGRCDPAEVLSISDVFILPNRNTYFDLILLEALSIGSIVLASNTGGNKTVYKDTGLIRLYNNEDEAVISLDSMLSDEFLNGVNKKQIIAEFEKHYSLSVFSENFLALNKRMEEIVQV